MKKLLILIISILFLPTLTYAVFDDSRFNTGSVVQVGAYTLDVIGTSTSIVVNDTTLVATLESGSTVTITSPTRNQLTTDTSTGVTNTCNSSVSSLSISGATTVTVTPTATICADAVVTPTPQPSSSGSSGSRYVPPVLVATTTRPATTTTYFTRDLTIGSIGTDVMKLQQFLNTKGYNVTLLGEETMYFGNKTKESLIKFQKDNAISSTGYFGPLTRTLINRLLTNITIPITVPTLSTNIFTKDLSLGMTNSDITRLQTILYAQNFLRVSPTGYFGNLTLQAVKAYQTAHGITPTGYVGPVTRRELNK